ncbi:MAG: hypothetical protein AB7D06_00250 [Pedobacter sp.]
MTGKKQKFCEIQDTEELRSHLIQGGKMTCAKCCATSNDPEELCEPVKTPGANLFCDGFLV